MWDWITKLNELKATGRPFAFVTVVDHKGSSPREAGAKMIVLVDGTFFGTIGGGQLEGQAIDDAKACLHDGKSKKARYILCGKLGQCCGGTVEVFIEVMNLHPHLYIFGAGHVGQALSRTMAGTPFAVHVVDARREWIGSPNIPTGTLRHECAWEEFVRTTLWDDQKTYAAVMTHSHDIDREIIEEVTTRPARYIGLIGSRHKWTEFQLRLRQKGILPERLSRVQCPIGKTLAGKTPQEVAISIAAELLRIHHDRS